MQPRDLTQRLNDALPRFVVQVNMEGIAGESPGEWEDFVGRPTMLEALRDGSFLLETLKASVRLWSGDDDGGDDAPSERRIEPWIRITDTWNETILAHGSKMILHAQPKHLNGPIYLN